MLNQFSNRTYKSLTEQEKRVLQTFDNLSELEQEAIMHFVRHQDTSWLLAFSYASERLLAFFRATTRGTGNDVEAMPA